MKIKDANVLITGGASGIGKIMGRIALEKGAKNLIIWDINEKNIEATIEEYKSKGSVKGYIADVSDNAKILQAYEKTVAECGDIDILIQCAGIVTSNKTFDKMSTDEITRTIAINTTAPMLVAHSMLGRMIERNCGHICTITSAAGLLAIPKMSVYDASKWGATGWSDSVRIELKDMHSKVRITTVAPYFINTGMFDGVRSKIFNILDPEKTSAKIIKAIEKNMDTRGIPFAFHFIRFCQAIFPSCVFDYIFGEVVGVYHCMDHFTGRRK